MNTDNAAVPSNSAPVESPPLQQPEKSSSPAEKLSNTADGIQLLPHVYPPAILYAKGDAFAACRSARKIFDDSSADDESRKTAQLFLKTVSMDRMMKGVIILASAVVLLIILLLYVF